MKAEFDAEYNENEKFNYFPFFRSGTDFKFGQIWVKFGSKSSSNHVVNISVIDPNIKMAFNVDENMKKIIWDN